MTNIDAPIPTQDERVMAALSHISVFLPMMGVIAPIVIWVTQKEKSQYVAFQALQAMAYQLSMIAAMFIGMGCYMCSFFSTFVSMPIIGSSNSNTPFLAVPFLIPFFVMGALFIIGFSFIAYGAIGAIMVFQGKPFRYIIIGNRVDRFMQKKQAG